MAFLGERAIDPEARKVKRAIVLQELHEYLHDVDPDTIDRVRSMTCTPRGSSTSTANGCASWGARAT